MNPSLYWDDNTTIADVYNNYFMKEEIYHEYDYQFYDEHVYWWRRIIKFEDIYLSIPINYDMWCCCHFKESRDNISFEDIEVIDVSSFIITEIINVKSVRLDISKEDLKNKINDSIHEYDYEFNDDYKLIGFRYIINYNGDYISILYKKDDITLDEIYIVIIKEISFKDYLLTLK